MSSFAVALGEVASHRFVYSSEDLLPMDNTITYASPTWGGWQVMLQYSMGMDESTGTENESTVDRYMAAAIHFDNKNTEFNLVVDSTNFRSFGSGSYDNPDDGLRVTAGIRHGLGFMTLYVDAQYFKDSRNFAQESNHSYAGPGSHNKIDGTTEAFLDPNIAKDGFGLNLGLDYSALGGTWKAQTGYMDAEHSDDSNLKMKRWYVSAGCWYDFSKRTTLYSGVSYIRDSLEGGEYDQFDKAQAVTASLGLVHNF